MSLRSRPAGDRWFKTEEDGAFDLRATAFSYGLSVPALEARLRARQRQTALLAYGASGLGLLFLVAWVREALGMTWSVARLLTAIEFLPFVALFFLFGFYNALLNYQIRIGQRASWRDYLATRHPLLPR